MKLSIIDCILVVTLCVKYVTGIKIKHSPAPIEHHIDDHWEYPRYAFDYAVHDPFTGDFKHQWEERDGELLKGEYGLVDPDGTLRIVKYTSDPHHGYNAEVKKIGLALHHEPLHEIHHEPHHGIHHEPHHVTVVAVPQLIPIIKKPVRHTSIIEKIKGWPIMKKKEEYYEHMVHKLDEYNPFKPLKHLIENVKKSFHHEKPPIGALFEPHHDQHHKEHHSHHHKTHHEPQHHEHIHHHESHHEALQSHHHEPHNIHHHKPHLAHHHEPHYGHHHEPHQSAYGMHG